MFLCSLDPNPQPPILSPVVDSICLSTPSCVILANNQQVLILGSEHQGP